MEKTIKEVKERAENLKKSILQAINDFEVANPEVDVRVTVGRNYSTVEDDTKSHRVDVDLTIK
jgi:hypothetical protein|nr:MAG TPA: hypothetical protein [Crassvirales sp.]